MKVSAIQPFNYYQSYRSVVRKDFTPSYPSFQNPSFGIANAGKLKTLFSYGVPCMYSGKEMIDPVRVQKLMKTDAFKRPVIEVLKILNTFANQLGEKEAHVLKIIKEMHIHCRIFYITKKYDILISLVWLSMNRMLDF